MYLHSLVHTSACFLNIHLYLKKEDSNFDSHNTMFFDFKGDSNMYRSSHPRCSVKKSVIKNSASFTGNHLNWSLFSGLQACNFIKKRFQHRCFPVNFAKLLRTPTLKNTYERLLLYRAWKDNIKPRCKFRTLLSI